MSRSTRLVVRTLLPASAAAAALGWVVAPAWTAPAPAGLGLTVVAAPQNVRSGDTISAKVTVSNTLDVPVSGVSVSAPGAPACARTNLSVPAKGEISYRCSMTAGEPGTHRSSMTVTGTARGRQLSATATVPYKATGRGYYPTQSASATPSCNPPMPSGSTSPPSKPSSASSTPHSGTPSSWPSELPSGLPSAAPSESSDLSTRKPCFPRTGELPNTGDRGVPAALWVIAAGLLAAGGALVVFGRHLRERFHTRVLDRS